MVHSLLAAWRVSLHRTRADWPIVAAAALISLLAATLLAAGPIYSAAVSEAGMRRVLQSAPTTTANIGVAARVPPGEAPAVDQQMRELLGRTVGVTGAAIDAGGVSEAFSLPGQEPNEIRDLLRIGFKDGLEQHATLVAGAWPVRAAPDAPIQLAVLEGIATTLDHRVGAPLAIVGRSDESLAVEAQVVAIYRPTDPTASYWWVDPALLDGVSESTDYRTFGPVMTAREDLLERAAGGRNVLFTWHAFPTFEALPIADVPGLRVRVDQLRAEVQAALPGGFTSVETGLPALLATAERQLLASRTGVLLLLAQLAILAGYAIALTADLIVDQRRLDTAMLRSRGASTRQVAVLALAEAALLAVPAALLAPWLAALALRLFNIGGPLAGIGLVIEPTIGPDAYLAAAGAAIGCALLLVLPAFNAARSFATERSSRDRSGTRTLGQRLGLDIALLAVTGIGLWQLRLYGTPLTQTVQGAVGIDPLLVAAPAVGILAGSVVALRIVPLLASVADVLAARGRHLVGSLGARQLARRPLRYTRTALLLILAISMGVFSLAYGTTWTQSQADQARFQVGADLRVTPATGLDAMPGWAVGAAYASIDGVASGAPVSRDRFRLTQVGTGELVGIDAGWVATTDGLAVQSAAERATLQALGSALVDARPEGEGVELPGTPTRVAIATTVRFDAAEGFSQDPRSGEFTTHPVDAGAVFAATTAVPTVTVRDAQGLIQRLSGSPTPIAADGWSFVVPIPGTSPSRAATVERLGGGLAYPIRLIAVDLELNVPRGNQVTEGRISLQRIGLSDEAIGDDWQLIEIGQLDGWGAAWSSSGGQFETVLTDRRDGIGFDVGSDDEAGVSVVPGVDQQGRGVRLSFAPISVTALSGSELAVIVNRRFADGVAAQPGDRVLVAIPGGSRRLHIVGVIDAFPTTDPSIPVAVADLGTMALLRYGTDRGTVEADEWWLDLTPGASEAAIEAARAGGPLTGATVLSQVETRERLTSEPLALATIGALSLGFVVAGLFAVIGLAVSAAVSARQRRTEFALLRALGLSPDQLSGWLWLENASVVVVSILAGTGLGLVISWVVLPFVTVTPNGATPFPPVVVDVPWASVLVLEAVSIAALALTLLVIARWMRGLGVGSVLRMGED